MATASAMSNVTPIMDSFQMREQLARNIKRDLRDLLLATAAAVSKQPVHWSDVRALLPIPVEKALAMNLIADENIIASWEN